MALHRRDLISAVNSFNSQLASDFGITASETSSTTESIQTTTSSGPSTTSTKAASTVKSTASSTSKSTKSASSSADSTATSSITSTSSSASTSTTTNSPSSSSSSTSFSSSTRSSTPSTSTQTTTITSTPTPTALSTTSSNSDNQISTAGVAVAAVFALLIISGILYLLWKYLPSARRYRERAYQSRSHREGLTFSAPRKGLAFSDEESTHDLHLDDPKLGLGLRKFSFHAAPTYYPGQPHEPDADLSQCRPLTSASSEHDHIVSPLSTQSMRSHISHAALPTSLQAGPASHMPYAHPYEYQDVRASQIGVALPFSGGGGGSGNANSRPGSREKGLPPLPLPSNGYGRPFQ